MDYRKTAQLAVGLTLILLAANAAGSSLPVLTTAAAVNRLTIAEAKAGRPVDLHGVVTYADVKLGHIFLQDRTAGAFVYFDPTGSEPELTAGQTIEVTGVTTPGDFSSCIKNGKFKITGHAPLPEPKRLPFDQLLTGRWACYWAELKGIILSVRVLPGSFQLNLGAEGGSVLVIMRQFPHSERFSIGSKVLLRGSLSALYNDRRQALGVKIFVPGPEYITVLKAALADPYATPLLPLSTIGQYDVSSDLEAQVRVRGTVTAVEPGTRIYVADADTSLAMEVLSTCSPRPRDYIEAFSQADAATTRKFGGTGLGLTISSRLAQMMGGRIWVESEPGRGSCFHFTVDAPIAQVNEGVADLPVASLAGKRLLIVDDNATNRRILAELAVAEGMLSVQAKDAAAALLELEAVAGTAHAFDLAMIDCHMPDVDGFTLTEQIRQRAALAATPLLMLTSAGQRGDAARCRSLGIAAYLTKPVSQAQLVEAMRLALGRASDPIASKDLITRHSLPANASALRILLAEDNLVNQKVARRMLEKENHFITVAANGVEVLQTLQREKFDLILMDIQMPEMDGLQATAAIRDRERFTGERIPIIALTAHAMSGDRERFLAAGIDGYVTKPIRISELVSEISRLREAATVLESA